MRPEHKDELLAKVLRATAAAHLSWGFWKIFDYLRLHNIIQDNHKRVYRIWCEEKLNLRPSPKRQRIYREYQELLSPDGINEGWAMDFVSDWVVGPTRKQVRIINIMDEGSRRALWTEAHKSIPGKKLTSVLDQVVEYRGRPAYIRYDNGPELISKSLKEWAQKNDIELRYIQPGKPSQNGLIERLNKTLRQECLNLTSTDNGQSFSVLNTGLPPCRVEAFATNADESNIFAATSIGPFAYEKSENAWSDISSLDAPLVQYMDVEFLNADNTVRFATYARGIWDFQLTPTTSTNSANNRNLNIKAYPNPANDFINIEVDDDLPNWNYQIVIGSGEMIKTGILNSKTIVIHISDLPSGTYFINIEDYVNQPIKFFKL